MDGLRGAASGIAVISLAIQLASSIQDIQRFMRNVSGASKELERLMNLLDQLYLLLHGIKSFMQKLETREPRSRAFAYDIPGAGNLPQPAGAP